MPVKIFVPPQSVEFPNAIQMSDGLVVPKWVFCAVPLTGDPVPSQERASSRGVLAEEYRRLVDPVTGRLKPWSESGANSEIFPLRPRQANSEVSSAWDFQPFGWIDAQGLVAAGANAVPRFVREVIEQEVNPGYFTAVPGDARTPYDFTVSTDDDYSSGSYRLSSKYALRDLLVASFSTSRLEPQAGLTTLQIVTNLKGLVVNVLDLVNEPNPYVRQMQATANLGYSDAAVGFDLHSGLVNSQSRVSDRALLEGRGFRIRFDDGDSVRAYQKAVDVALKTDFDTLSLDYFQGGPTLLTVTWQPVGNRRKIATRWENVVVHDGRIVHTYPDPSLYSAGSLGTLQTETGSVVFNETSDFSAISSMLQNFNLFGSVQAAQQLTQALGGATNPFISGLAGLSGLFGGTQAPTQSMVNQLSAAVRCPTSVNKPDKNFPTSSHAAMRHLSDVTQLDDKSTQDRIPFPLRINNPLKVKKVAGVTDLKTRFGYLGESEGYAVYRDHIGGAAAGLALLMQSGQGMTMGKAASSLAGDLFTKVGAAAQQQADDVTAASPEKTFANLSRDLFGVTDPSGVMAECGIVDSNRPDDLVSYAASLAKTNSNLQMSPLTHAEWMSAYQIAKNQPNKHVKKSTTGATLPVTEEQNTQDTGTQTASQANNTFQTAEKTRVEATEKWNPLSNFKHYSENLWGANGAGWIQKGLLSYEEKSSQTDRTKMAKKLAEQKLNQDGKHPTDQTVLPWTPPGQPDSVS